MLMVVEIEVSGEGETEKKKSEGERGTRQIYRKASGRKWMKTSKQTAT
jgi:hypothetical protein